MFDIIVIGHLTHDHVRVGDKELPQSLGGTTAYVSMVASRLGARVGIVSKVGADFRFEETLRRGGVDLMGLRVVERGTTTFENLYDGSGRRLQRVSQRCEDISLKDVPENYFEAKCFHIGALVQEVDLGIAREAFKQKILTSLDLQGYCRSINAEGLVHLSGWNEAEGALKYIKILKGDLEEALCASKTSDIEEAMDFFWGCGVQVVLVTMGRDGSLLGYDGTVERIPALKSGGVVDPTGAGDAYAAGFLFDYLRSMNPSSAALFASSVASFAVEGWGFSNVPTEKAVRKRVMGSSL